MSGATPDGKVWLRYEPGPLIQERPNLKNAYEIRHVELDIHVGRVEHYWEEAADMQLRWRTLDTWNREYRTGFRSREAAAQDLVQTSPRVLERIAGRRRLRELRAEGGPAS